jgi:hypothetical protein
MKRDDFAFVGAAMLRERFARGADGRARLRRHAAKECKEPSTRCGCRRCCGAHYSVADVTALAAIEFMKPAKLVRRWSMPTSLSGIRGSRGGPAPGLRCLTFSAAHCRRVGTDSPRDLSPQSTRKHAEGYFFCQSYPRARQSPERLTTADSASVHRRSQIISTSRMRFHIRLGTGLRFKTTNQHE